MTTKLTTMFVFSFVVSFFKAETCPTYTCDTLPSGMCANTTSTNPESYVLQKCQDNQQCPFQNIDASPQLNCENKTVHDTYFLFPGAPCKNFTDCDSQNCTEGVCVGTPVNEHCSNNKECSYGNTCRMNTTANVTQCLPQLTEGSCTKDTDCVNTMGCWNGTCTNYFSLSDNTTVDTPAEYAPLSFCRSGWDYKGVCSSWKNVGGPEVTCNDTVDCVYTDSFGQNITLPEKCLCGYNPTGTKHCEIGSAEANYTRYVDKLKTLLINTTWCHTEERGSQCNYNLKYPTTFQSGITTNLTNSRIWGLFGHQLVDANDCVIDVVYPEYNKTADGPEPEPTPSPSPPSPTPPEPTPENSMCAKYECQSKQSTCAQSFFKPNATRVVLSDICNKTQYCDVGGEPNIVFYNGSNVTGTCEDIKYPDSTVRFPGEECSKSSECFPYDNVAGLCMSGKCVGYNETQSCNTTVQCSAGLYCNKTTTNCEKQKGKGDYCHLTSECQNKYLCFENTCQDKWFSQIPGVNITGKGDIDAAYYCTFGFAINGICASRNTTTKPDSKSGLVACTPGSDCQYDLGPLFGKLNLTCECGYNADGLAYCPKGHDSGK